jgi:drug/metabolite transporter (DMT)-like permease
VSRPRLGQAARTRIRTTDRAVLALLALLAVAVVWGSSFPLTKVILETLSARQYLSIRFVIAAAVMFALFHRSVLALPRRSLWIAVGLGALYGAAQLVQTTGLEYTPATISGFITGLYVVLTPLCGAVIFHTPIGRRVWIGVVLAVMGLGILSLNGLSLGYGEVLTLISALLFALHIVGLGHWARPREALGVAVVQLMAIAVVSIFATIPEGFKAPHGVRDWVILLYLALISGALAMIVQTWSQSLLPASRAAIIMSSEPGWSAVFSIAFLGEPLTWRVLVGGALMLAAMLVVELGPRAVPDEPRPEDLPKLAA